MQIYIGYRYTGADKELLKSFLTSVSHVLENKGHQTFMYFRDGGNWQKKEGAIALDKVILDSFEVIKKSDAVLILVQSNDFSEGMILDLGCAIANNKKIIIAKKIGTSLPKSEALASQIIEYIDNEDLISRLESLEL